MISELECMDFEQQTPRTLISLPRFSILYLFFGLGIAGISWSLQKYFPHEQILAKNFWVAFVFLFMLTYIAYFVSDIGIKKSPQTGVVAVLGGILLKLLFALGFVLLIILKTSENQLVFALNYFSIYLLLTLFEVMCLLRNLRDQNKK